MKKSTVIWFIIMIVSYIGLGFFLPALFSIVNITAAGTYFSFGWMQAIGISFVVIALVSSGILFAQFLESQPLARQLLFVSIPPAAALIIGMYFLFTLASNNVNTPAATIIRAAFKVGANGEGGMFMYIWLGALMVLYFIYLFLIFLLMTLPVQNKK